MIKTKKITLVSVLIALVGCLSCFAKDVAKWQPSKFVYVNFGDGRTGDISYSETVPKYNSIKMSDALEMIGHSAEIWEGYKDYKVKRITKAPIYTNNMPNKYEGEGYTIYFPYTDLVNRLISSGAASVNVWMKEEALTYQTSINILVVDRNGLNNQPEYLINVFIVYKN